MEYVINSIKLKELMDLNKIKSHNALAKSLNMHRATLKAYMEGLKSPFTTSVKEIAQFFNIDPIELIKKQEKVHKNNELMIIKNKLGAWIKQNSWALAMFGSRSRKTNKKFSDLDLGITGGEKKITTDAFLTVKTLVEDISEDFPICVDIVNLDQAPLNFLLNVDKDLQFVVGDKTSYSYLKGKIHGAKH